MKSFLHIVVVVGIYCKTDTGMHYQGKLISKAMERVAYSNRALPLNVPQLESVRVPTYIYTYYSTILHESFSNSCLVMTAEK